VSLEKEVLAQKNIKANEALRDQGVNEEHHRHLCDSPMRRTLRANELHVTCRAILHGSLAGSHQSSSDGKRFITFAKKGVAVNVAVNVAA